MAGRKQPEYRRPCCWFMLTIRWFSCGPTPDHQPHVMTGRLAGAYFVPMIQKFLRLASWSLLLVACQATSDPVAHSAGNTPPATGNCVPTPAGRAGVVKILFVGNSLTYTNDVPSMVAALGRDHGTKIEKEVLAKPNYALEDHWNEGCLQTMIKSGYFDFVVVQQGPSSQADGASSLLEYGDRIQQLCKAHDTRLAFYMVWPARYNYHMFPGVIKNYTAAAEATNAILCPAGSVWKEYIDSTGDWSYYGPDEFHPSPIGSAIAAEIIYKALFN